MGASGRRLHFRLQHLCVCLQHTECFCIQMHCESIHLTNSCHKIVFIGITSLFLSVTVVCFKPPDPQKHSLLLVFCEHIHLYECRNVKTHKKKMCILVRVFITLSGCTCPGLPIKSVRCTGGDTFCTISHIKSAA